MFELNCISLLLKYTRDSLSFLSAILNSFVTCGIIIHVILALIEIGILYILKNVFQDI